MDIKQAARALDGNEYREEGSTDLFARMKEAGLVAVFGASDDLMELRGAVYDEVPAYEGGYAYLDENGLLQNECDNEDCPHFEKRLSNSRIVLARWCAEPDLSWTYETVIPHETFTIMEDGDPYCRGIVFALADIPICRC